MYINVNKLIDISIPTLEGFAKIEPRTWGMDGNFLELFTEIGSLGRILTIFGNYRHGKRSKHAIADELSDILFVLIKIIQGLKIPSPKSKLRITDIASPEKSFFQLLKLAMALKSNIENSADINFSYLKIEKMIAILFGIAEKYNVCLLDAHVEEMKHAQLWQRTFFNSDGGKKKHFMMFRKIFFHFSAKRHIKQLN